MASADSYNTIESWPKIVGSVQLERRARTAITHRVG